MLFPILFLGLEFIRSSAWAATDKDNLTPIGFDIVFPMMVNYANELDLTLPFNQDLVDFMFRNRASELKRLVLITLFGVTAIVESNCSGWFSLIHLSEKKNQGMKNSYILLCNENFSRALIV